MKRLVRAFLVFTFLRHVQAGPPKPADIGPAVVYAPLVGFCLGLALMALVELVEPYLD
jgi:hypothetical protein